MDQWYWLCKARGLHVQPTSDDANYDADSLVNYNVDVDSTDQSSKAKLLRRLRDAEKRRKRTKKSALRGLDLSMRIYDLFTRTFDSLRPTLENLAENLRSLDSEVSHGIGCIEDKRQAHGIAMGTSVRSVFGISDLLFNPNKKEYVVVTKQGTIHHYDWALALLPEIKAPKMKKFTNFIYIEHTSNYICWNRGKLEFYLTKENFTSSVSVVSLEPISRIFYTETGKTEESVIFFVVCGNAINKYCFFPVSNLVNLVENIRITDIDVEKSKIEQICWDRGTEDRKQFIFLTHSASCSIIDITGRNHGTKRNIHTCRITAICSASELIVTGDEEGYLKLWGPNWQLNAETQAFNCPVTILMTHPSGNAVVAFSKSQYLYAWGIRSHKKLEVLKAPEMVERLAINLERSSFITQGPRKIQIWKMDILYTLLTPLNSHICSCYPAWNPNFPQRIAITDSDNAIRVINPISGAILTTILVNPQSPKIHGSDYDPATGTIYTLGETDEKEMTEENKENSSVKEIDIQIFDTSTNPGSQKNKFKSHLWDSTITAIALYDYIKGVALQEVTMTFMTKKFREFKGATSFLIGGRADGCICSINLEKGKQEYVVPCHKSVVTQISINFQLNQFASLGIDPSIRLWKISINHDDIFMPLMDISWKFPIRCLTIVRDYFCFALSHGNSDTHKVVIFNMLNQERNDNRSHYAHKKEIVGISSNSELLLFCTCSQDETLRIWNEKCELIRILNLNMVPTFIAFGTKQGDLFIGAGQGLYLIPANKHLTKLYRNRVMMLKLNPGSVENPVPFNQGRVGEPRLDPSVDQMERLPLEMKNNELIKIPKVEFHEEPRDSHRAKELEKLKFLENDLQLIIKGEHPLSPDVPDPSKMTYDQLNEFGKGIFGSVKGENRKYFVADSRRIGTDKLLDGQIDLQNYDTIRV